MTFDPTGVDNPDYETEAALDHAAGVTNECLQGRCGNCWDDDCGCPLCGHPGAGKVAS